MIVRGLFSPSLSLDNPKKRPTILLGKRGIRGAGPLLGCNNDGSCISNYISWVIARFIPIKVGSKKKSVPLCFLGL